MPKKLSTNPKALEAREKKEQKKMSLQEEKARREEDAKWKDHDKDLQKKQDRKQELERKRLEILQRKTENRALYEQEMGQYNSQGNKTTGITKVSKAEIEYLLEKKKLERLKEEEEKQKREKKRLAIQDLPEENVNRIEFEGEEARTIEEAICILSVSDALDRHPEKRMKASYKAFEEAHLPALKQENPTLKLSQLKQMLKKDWNKSPDNPLNQRQ